MQEFFLTREARLGGWHPADYACHTGGPLNLGQKKMLPKACNKQFAVYGLQPSGKQLFGIVHNFDGKWMCLSSHVILDCPYARGLTCAGEKNVELLLQSVDCRIPSIRSWTILQERPIFDQIHGFLHHFPLKPSPRSIAPQMAGCRP